jgi:peptide-methionine (R)-S-oxide reductase
MVRHFAWLAFACAVGCSPAGAPAHAKEAAPMDSQKEHVVHTDAEWKKILTPEQYRVLRQKGTEPPFSSPYNSSHEHAIYRCAGCGLVLFRSEDKFESGTGWPSFTRPATPNSVEVTADNSLGMERDEVHCPRCGGHLGHVFDDGPKPTGKRYCMNGVALKQEIVK